MSVTFKDIYHQLEKNVIRSNLVEKLAEIELTEVRLLVKNQGKFKKGAVYVGTMSFIHKHSIALKDANLIVINDSTEPFDLTSAGVNASIELDNSCDLFESFNMISEVFNDNIKINNIRESEDLYQVADRAAKLLKNPIIFIDSSYRVLAHSKTHPIMDTVWKDNIEKGYCSYEFIAYVRNMKDVKQAFNNSTPFILSCYKSPFKRYASKFFLGGKLVGHMIVLMENEELDARERELVMEISQIAAISFQNNLSKKNLNHLGYENFLMDLIDNKITDLETLNEKIKIYDESFRSQMVILALEISGFDASQRPVGYLSKEIEKILNRRHIYYENQIVVLYDFNHTNFENIDTVKHLKEFALENNVIIGVSNVFSDLTLSRKYYLEAKKAIELREKMDNPDQLIEFKDVGFYALLNEAEGLGIDVEAYIHPSLRVLRLYDQANQTDLYNTLFMYLKTNQNSVYTGSELFLHRNTVKYRIDKIVEITGIDLASAYEVFSLMFSYRTVGFRLNVS
ncbi:MAG TPA: PucR family transcriptional regulator [Epulopiscium sp.]|nr:PucR family transcriptional regulator [Candidatus Epulonipiscium sp.]